MGYILASADEERAANQCRTGDPTPGSVAIKPREEID